LVPTLAFGIPGSAAMAVFLGALLVIGITPGPKFLIERTDLLGIIVATMVVSNILGGLICLLFADAVSKITNVKSNYLVPAVFAFVSIGAFTMRGSIVDVWVAFLFGGVGYIMKKINFPRAALLLGLILGNIAEVNFHLSMQRYGIQFLTRPIVLILLLCIVVSLIVPYVKKARKSTGIGGGIS
jgi:TctA family transporter